jgi:hypothetical protein
MFTIVNYGEGICPRNQIKDVAAGFSLRIKLRNDFHDTLLVNVVLIVVHFQPVSNQQQKKPSKTAQFRIK